MSSSDPSKGGDLFDMAKDGTSVTADASKPRIIPSVPRPDQKQDHTGGIGGPPDLAGAADNATDIPRGPGDSGGNPEVISGTGDQLPSTVQAKHGHGGADNDRAKGSARYEKHTASKSEFDRFAREGAEVEPAPGEEDLDQDTIRDSKGA